MTGVHQLFVNYVAIMSFNIFNPNNSWSQSCKFSSNSPAIVMEEVYCFPRRQLIFSFGWCVMYQGLWEYIPKSIPSVCTTILKQIAGLCFYHKSLMLYINGFVLTSSTKLRFFFKISNLFLNNWPKTIEYSNN